MHVDFDQVKRDSTGRWFAIFAHLGINVGDGRHTKCPICQNGKNHFRCDDKDGKGTWICTCGAGDGWKMLQEVLDCSFKEAIEQVAPIVGTLPERMIPKEKAIDPQILRNLIKNSTKSEKGDLVSRYLSGRGTTLLPGNLRSCNKCYDPERKGEYPAMLAIVQDHEGTAVTIHRTFVDPDTGGKAKIDKPKKLMPGLKKLTGCAIRLFEPQNGAIGLAEGIETAAACTEKFMLPTWACISNTIMESFIPPKGIRKIYIFGDNDKSFAGQKSAYVLANRLVLKKYEVEVIIPNEVGDFLDGL